MTHFSLYSTAEPCLMCMGAAIWFRIRRVYFGVTIQELEELGFEQITISTQIIAQHSPWTIKVCPHVFYQPILDFYKKYSSSRTQPLSQTPTLQL